MKDIPLSVDNSVIVDELEKRKYKVSGKVMLPKLRVDGQLTNCLTGDRVIYIERPTQSVPRLISFGVFRGKVFHANQTPKDQTIVMCSNCLNKGHHRSACTSQVVCRFCKKEGHYQRDCSTSVPENEEGHERPTGAQAAAAAPDQPGGDEHQSDCSTSVPENEEGHERPTGAQADAATPDQPGRDESTAKKAKGDVTKETRRSAESRDGPESRSNPPGATSAGKDNAPGSKQCKITQFIQHEREDHAKKNEQSSRSSVVTEMSGDEQSDLESEEIESDDCTESEISIESPVTPIARPRMETRSNKKRKQKGEKKPKKK